VSIENVLKRRPKGLTLWLCLELTLTVISNHNCNPNSNPWAYPLTVHMSAPLHVHILPNWMACW